MKPVDVANGLLKLAVMVLMSLGLTLVFLFSAPRPHGGEGGIPEGCTILTHMQETLVGPGEHPKCFIPGAVVPDMR